MSQVFVTDREGQEKALDILPGATLMQTITDAGIPDLLALCGGVCSCATCHVYIDSKFADALPPVSEDEDELLSCSPYRQENSRLSCQIRLEESLDGLKATIAPEED